MQFIKYVALAFMIFIALYFLEWFGVIDVPFLEIRDFTAGKRQMMEKTIEAIEKNGEGK